MAYGKGQTKDKDKRVADIGRMPVQADLARIRQSWLDAADRLCDAAWPDSILRPLRTGKELDAILLPAQRSLTGTMYSVWAEKARLSVKAAAHEQHKRAQRRLFGKFRNIGSVGDNPVRLKDGREARRLLNLPEEWSFRLSDRDVAELKALAASMDFPGTMAFFRKVRDGVTNLPPIQQEALRVLLASVEERFDRPRWDREESTVQLHLDYRCVPKDSWQPLLASLNDGMTRTLATGKSATVPFALRGALAGGASTPLVATLRQDILGRLANEAGGKVEIAGVAVEIGPREVVLKAVLAQEPQVMPLDRATHLLGRDFGNVTTAAHTIVPIGPGGIDPARLDLAAGIIALEKDDVEAAKAMARGYLSSHFSSVEPVEQVRHCGRDFLDRIATHAEHVDRLRAEIDRLYNRMGRLRHEINRILGRPEGTLVDLAARHEDRRLADLTARFGKLLRAVGRLKRRRRDIYRTVDGLKRSWFGWLTTQEANLARKYNAAVVREHLTYVAIPTDHPRYRGRTFNRMNNNGSRGQYTSRGSDKLKWRSIPELVVPSFYTSCTDHRYAVVDPDQRRGERFKARADGFKDHADTHASHTVALWLMLEPARLSAEADTIHLVTNEEPFGADAYRFGRPVVHHGE